MYTFSNSVGLMRRTSMNNAADDNPIISAVNNVDAVA